MMEPIVAPFTERLRQMKLSAPQIALPLQRHRHVGDRRQATDPAYWARHLRQPVRFAAALSAVCKPRRCSWRSVPAAR